MTPVPTVVCSQAGTARQFFALARRHYRMHPEKHFLARAMAVEKLSENHMSDYATTRPLEGGRA